MALCSCSTALEAVFEVTTEAVERTEKDHDVELNPAGDSLRLPAGIADGKVSWGGGSAGAPAGAEVKVAVEETGSAPGRRTRVLIDGKEVCAADGSFRVMASWRLITEKALPPVVWAREVKMEPGGKVEIDQTVMYSCAGTSTFRDLRTTFRFTGPDASRFVFRPSTPVEGGRVKGDILAVEESN